MTKTNNFFRILSILVTIFFCLEHYYYYNITDPMSILMEITPWLLALQGIKMFLNLNIVGIILILAISPMHPQILFVVGWGGFLLTFFYMYMDFRRWRRRKLKAKTALERAYTQIKIKQMNKREGKYAHYTKQEMINELME